AQLEMNMIAEGYYAVKTVHDMNKELKVSMPIARFVYDVVYENKRARLIVNDLLDKLN
ncbi:MAG: glycerol-3-phosphate dehydrogenase (NAD(P)+), partial [Bacteroidia bacterium]